jgi:hypothetical protein
MPAEPALVGRMVSLSEGPCATAFCVSLRQVVGAMVTESAEQFTGEWNDETHDGTR